MRQSLRLKALYMVHSAIAIPVSACSAVLSAAEVATVDSAHSRADCFTGHRKQRDHSIC